MQVLTFEEGGRTRRIERSMTLTCRHCRARLSCPDEADFWEWAKSEDVTAFRHRHAHGAPDAVISEMAVIEKD